MGGTEWSTDQTLCTSPHVPNDGSCDWRCNDGWVRGINYGAGNATACWLPIPPVIDVNGVGTVHIDATHDETQFYTDEGASCSDNELHCATPELCDLNPEVVVAGDVVDMTTVGTYAISYECTSPSSLIDAITKYRVVIVSDNSCPTCEFAIAAEAEVNVEASFPYSASASPPLCSDNCGFSADAKCNVDTQPGVVVSGDVDVELTGTYHVTYNAGALRLENQCESTNLVRTVHVLDTLKPMIHLADSMTLVAEVSSVKGWALAGTAFMVGGLALVVSSSRTTKTEVPV